MSPVSAIKNWNCSSDVQDFNNILESEINIAIYERSVDALQLEIDQLINQEVEFRSSGDIDSILRELNHELRAQDYPLIIADIKFLIQEFKKVSFAKSFRILLSTVNTNMCKRFHTDINDLRMLCTYSGPGTLWLKEEHIDRGALGSGGNNEKIAIDEKEIQQAKNGSVIILKGALYPAEGTKAAVHRSPTIEESGETRLLLRIDTNDSNLF